MEGLAVEILEKISTFACTDGGRTGCSLSLTSRYIREATRSARFHSISLVYPLSMTSDEQIKRFSSFFFAERAALSERRVPRLRHLRIPWTPAAAILCETFASELHSLVILQSWPPSDHVDVSGTEFPLLQELTILGSGLEFGGVYPHPRLPSLTRLHIAAMPSKPSQQLGAPDLRLWSARAPHVTHLRVSLVNDTKVVLLAQLANLVAPELKGLPLIFPDLEQAVVQLPGTRTAIRTSAQEWDLLMAPFLQGSPATRPLVLHSQKSDDLQTIRSDMERDWLERMAGGSGCWVEQ
ncbi:hypothetical protein BD311DRAFT_757953 [Dichomitus squalens]|uniref:F-box domain-containing protein n=1 Tax=Dichomitus squalens TaxID=114155 RepID=A0A4V2K0G3_9APHY|nr:hypothetical protein BD311DRAFT_757953 [Dichomitus squalens]